MGISFELQLFSLDVRALHPAAVDSAAVEES
ncbi:hypothetical protein ABIA33_001990 [Streptacidiphilus sp. MAP12-16]